MKIPKMIMFDYGQTLVNERKFCGLKGTEAVLKYAVKNRHHYTAREVQEAADVINAEMGRFDPQKRHLLGIEIPSHMFTSYLYESMGIEVPLSPKERDRVFWDAAAPGKPSDGMEDFLAFLKERGIRTGVISNITYCGEAVRERISRVIPDHAFEFIIATSEYMFRKPDQRIFRLALEKADLPPEEVWYIGDSYECDVVGAAGAGIFPVWYTGAADDITCGEREDVLTVKSWKELKDIMQKLPGA